MNGTFCCPEFEDAGGTTTNTVDIADTNEELGNGGILRGNNRLGWIFTDG
jgi:hypothetical protein